MKVFDWIHNNESLYFLLKCVKSVVYGNKEYISKCLHFEENPNIIEINHWGGENCGKIIYLIRECGRGFGFFAEFKVLLVALLYADEMGWEPSVWFGEKYLYYEEDGVNNERNAFEYYFEPIGNCQNIDKSMNVVLKKDIHVLYLENKFGLDGYKVPELMESSLASMIRKYIHLKQDLEDEFNNCFEDMFQGKRVIGIHYRGTDFRMGYNIHPKEISMEQIIECVKSALESHLFELIFLATDEQGIYEIIKDEFGDCVKRFQDVYRGVSNVSVAFSKSERVNHHYKLGYEVLRDAYTLSRCQGLVAGLSQVSFAARLLKRSRGENYNYMNIIDNGINNNDKYFNINDVI